jgi:hypothetical protein
VRATTRIVLAGPDLVRRLPGSYGADTPGVVTITPNRSTRREIFQNLDTSKVKTKLKAVGNFGGIDLDLRVFRFKR